MGIRIQGNIPQIIGIKHTNGNTVTLAAQIAANAFPTIKKVVNLSGTVNAGIYVANAIGSTAPLYSGSLPTGMSLANNVLTGNVPSVANATTFTSYFGDHANGVVQLNYTATPDPYAAQTTMLLSASHGVTDVQGKFSVAGANITAVANAAGAPAGQSSYFTMTSTSGSASAQNYTNTYIRAPSVPSAQQFGGNDFTIEMFIAPTSIVPCPYEGDYSACLLDLGDLGGLNHLHKMQGLIYNTNAFGGAGVQYIFFRGWTATGGDGAAVWTCNTPAAANGSSTMPMGQWNHIAFQRHGTLMSIMLNGTQVASTNYTPAIEWDASQAIGFGYYGYNSLANSYPYNGRMNGFRVTNGVCRYPGTTYTVPSAY